MNMELSTVLDLINFLLPRGIHFSYDQFDELRHVYINAMLRSNHIESNINSLPSHAIENILSPIPKCRNEKTSKSQTIRDKPLNHSDTNMVNIEIGILTDFNLFNEAYFSQSKDFFNLRIDGQIVIRYIFIYIFL